MAILKSRLFFKIMASYILLLFGMMLAVLTTVTIRIHENYLQAEHSRLQSMALILTGSLPPPSSQTTLQSWSEDYGKRTGCRITLIDSQGIVLADNQGSPELMDNHSNRPEVQAALQFGNGYSIRFSHTLKKNELYVASRATRADRGPIVLRLALPLQEVTEGYRIARRDLFLISFLSFLIVVCLGYLSARSLTNRIEKIRRFAEDVKTGNLDARIHGETGDELGMLANSLNATATQLQKIIGELGSEKQTITAILEGMRAGVLATDLDGRVTLVNPALERILGIDEKDSLGKKVIEVVRNAELKGIFDKVLMERREVVSTLDIALTPSRSFEVVAVPLSDHNLGHGGVVAVLHDMTRQKELEKVRRDFVANVSHELQTPLTAIRGFAETLLDGALDDRTHNRRFIEVIKSHAIRLSDLTKDLLKLASLESQSVQLEYEEIELPSLLHEAIESVKPLAAEKQQEIACLIPETLPGIRGDREKLFQVLVNLLDNAIKFTPEEGKVSLEASLQSDPGVVVIHVIDSGMGIPSSELPRIFERFYRVDKTRSREQGGTGLGLAIVKHIVEAHRGRVEVKSTLGRGSDFYFSLPLG
jgi:two-component system phosphate regulon sensor histidine kinase PhoR